MDLSPKKRGNIIFVSRRLLLISGIAALLWCGATSTAQADRRIFPYTYPYMTLPEGGLEIEHYLEAGYMEMDNPDTQFIEKDTEVFWEHEVELEYGITDHWDLGIYHVFEEAPYESFEYRGAKLRTRYRFAEEGQWPVDTGVYLEVAYFDNEVELEQRLILAKILGKLEVDFNLKVEQEFEKEKPENEWETEYVLNPLLGIGYHFNRKFAAGIEYSGAVEFENAEASPYTQFLGPSFSVGTEKFFWTFTAQPQLTDEDEEFDFRLRSLLGIYL